MRGERCSKLGRDVAVKVHTSLTCLTTMNMRGIRTVPLVRYVKYVHVYNDDVLYDKTP